MNILIGAQVFCWPKIINPLGHKTIPSAVGKTQILIEFFDGTKKVQLGGKKSLARVLRISHRFFAVDHPLCDV